MIMRQKISIVIIRHRMVTNLTSSDFPPIFCYKNNCSLFTSIFLYFATQNYGSLFTSRNLFTANKQLKTQAVENVPLNGRDANLDRQDGLEEAPLHNAVLIGVAVEYLERKRQRA